VPLIPVPDLWPLPFPVPLPLPHPAGSGHSVHLAGQLSSSEFQMASSPRGRALVTSPVPAAYFCYSFLAGVGCDGEEESPPLCVYLIGMEPTGTNISRTGKKHGGGGPHQSSLRSALPRLCPSRWVAGSEREPGKRVVEASIANARPRERKKVISRPTGCLAGFTFSRF
jgi:hypothetical protein